MALPLAEPTPLHRRESDVSHLAPHRIKRCTYRRLISDVVIARMFTPRPHFPCVART